MFNAQVIDLGPEALMTSFQTNLEDLLKRLSLKEARGYVVAFSGTGDLGRVQPANIGMIGGGSIEELKLIYQELGRTIIQTEEAQREEEAKAAAYDDYYREPLSPLESLIERLGFSINTNPSDGGPVLRCGDYPRCACGEARGLA